MDRKVKYYKAVNHLYERLGWLKDSNFFSQFLREFYDSLDGIIELLIYDRDLTREEKERILNYINKMKTKASKLPR